MNKKTLLAVIVVLIVITGVIYLAPSPVPAAAQGTGANKATGYAWSSNIGWLAFGNSNGDQYGVTYDDQGKFSGYAWSSNIGWVNFNPDASAAPSNPKLAACWGDGNTCSNSSTNGDTLTGWARACSVFAAGCDGALKADSARGGWDGWIKLAKGSGDTGGAYAVKRDLASGVIAGYAWGSDIVGWLQFKFRDNGSPIDPDSGCAVNPSQCTVSGGGCNPNEGTCGGGGSGLNVTCTVSPNNPNVNTSVTWTASVTGMSASGNLSYLWSVKDSSNNPAGGDAATTDQNIVASGYANPGTYSGYVAVTDNKGTPGNTGDDVTKQCLAVTATVVNSLSCNEGDPVPSGFDPACTCVSQQWSCPNLPKLVTVVGRDIIGLNSNNAGNAALSQIAKVQYDQNSSTQTDVPFCVSSFNSAGNGPSVDAIQDSTGRTLGDTADAATCALWKVGDPNPADTDYRPCLSACINLNPNEQANFQVKLGRPLSSYMTSDIGHPELRDRLPYTIKITPNDSQPNPTSRGAIILWNQMTGPSFPL